MTHVPGASEPRGEPIEPGPGSAGGGAARPAAQGRRCVCDLVDALPAPLLSIDALAEVLQPLLHRALRLQDLGQPAGDFLELWAWVVFFELVEIEVLRIDPGSRGEQAAGDGDQRG